MRVLLRASNVQAAWGGGEGGCSASEGCDGAVRPGWGLHTGHAPATSWGHHSLPRPPLACVAPERLTKLLRSPLLVTSTRAMI